MYMGEAAREPSLSAAWVDALGIFDRDLSPRRAEERAARTRTTSAGTASWADSNGWRPEALGYRDLRRFAAVLSERGMSKAAVARKLAAIRTFYLRCSEPGPWANPADLVASPKRDRKLPRVLSREEMATLLDRIPTRTPLDRDAGHTRAHLLRGLRAEEVINLDLDSPDFDAERLRSR